MRAYDLPQIEGIRELEAHHRYAEHGADIPLWLALFWCAIGLPSLGYDLTINAVWRAVRRWGRG